MAQVRYRGGEGSHPEPSFAFPILGKETPVLPYGNVDLDAGYHSRRIDSVSLPAGAWRPVNPFAAIYLAGVRKRSGPWFDVRLHPGEWREIQRRAPWIVKAQDAVALCAADVTLALREASVRPYRVL